MSPWRRGRQCVVALALVAVSGGCLSYTGMLSDFDAVVGVNPEAGEVTDLDYETQVDEWVASVDDPDSDIPEEAIENPSGFARDRMVGLVESVAGTTDVLRIGQVGCRLLLVDHADVGGFNQIEALEGMGELLAALGINPIDVWLQRMQRPDRAQLELETNALLNAIEPLAGDEESSFDPLARAGAVAALRNAESKWLLERAHDRRWLRAVVTIARTTDDPELRDAALDSIPAALGAACSRALVRGLSLPVPQVRETSAWIIFRCGGPASVPLLLSALSRTTALRTFRYPDLASDRRLLVRLCGQIRGDLLYMSVLNGPRPIEFLCDTVLRDDDPSLRLVATETMARCLGRPISFDEKWAADWWREYAVSGRVVPTEPTREDGH